jgi:hypothetical protein
VVLEVQEVDSLVEAEEVVVDEDGEYSVEYNFIKEHVPIYCFLITCVAIAYM